MRIAPFALAALLLLAGPAPAGDDDAAADIVVRRWLVLPSVDPTPRRTLRADAVFAKHLLDRASSPPKEGDELTGTLGKPAKWVTREADKDGDVDAQDVTWSYASVESATDRVVMAKLEGAGVLYVNGAGFTGDVYRLGDATVPVALKKGENDVYVAGPRGGFRLSFTNPELLGAPDEFGPGRSRLRLVWRNDLKPGAGADVIPWRVVNPTLDTIDVVNGRPIVPLGVGRGTSLSTENEVPSPPGVHRRSFYSKIDDSFQTYALVPPSPSDIDKSKIGLVLSLHGAGVDCMDQARAYAPKPDFWIVCPTNRGRYGFDWQDWGRLDAYEVLEDALKVTGVDPRRVYLTGHSMGGHGTWHLAANDPGRFLAIAPSAGWSSFDSYGAPKLTTPLGGLWRAADGASRTLDLVENLAQIPTYVLHGEKDDNVPLSEAQLMVDAITRAGGKPEFHVEPGMGHWWDKDEKTPGADCVDWPGIWELFRKTQPVGGKRTAPIDFTTTDVSVSSTMRGAPFQIVQAIEYGRPSRVTLREQVLPRREAADVRVEFIVTTENVRRLQVHRPDFELPDVPVPVVLDGRRIDSVCPGQLLRTANGWTVVPKSRWDEFEWLPWFPGEKEPWHCGPFKRAFANRFVLVYGTAGDDGEDRELLEKARYDSEVWAYRANGDANLMSDAQFLAGDFKDRNVILYGNADTNAAWSAVFDDDCPIQAKRGVMTVNGAKHEGVVAAAFVRPRKGSDVALAAAFADTGAAATRLFYQFPVFSSGIGIPDYVVFGPGFLREWDGDVRAVGWFDFAWRMR